MKLRGLLIEEDKNMTFPPFEMMAPRCAKRATSGPATEKTAPPGSPRILKRSMGRARGQTVYFAGCTASYVENDIGMASVRLLDAAGVDFTYLGDKELCCAHAHASRRQMGAVREVMRTNIASVKAAGADTVISCCPACDMMWRHVYPEWSAEARHRLRHHRQALQRGDRREDRGRRVRLPRTVNGTGEERQEGRQRQDGRWPGTTPATSAALGRLRAAARADQGHPERRIRGDAVQPRGGALLRQRADTDKGAAGGRRHRQDAAGRGQRGWRREVLALCPCCEFQLRVAAEKRSPIEVVDLARFSRRGSGLRLPDPNPEVQRSGPSSRR